MPNFRVGKMTPEDLRVAFEFEILEGWNPRCDEVSALLCADATESVMGWVDDKPVACISVIKHGSSFAFIGMCVVLCRAVLF